MFKKVSRVGCASHKVLFTIYVNEIIFGVNVDGSAYDDIKKGDILSLCFERGGKLASTNDKMFLGNVECSDSQGTSISIFPVNESLSLVATVYTNSTGKYQQKKGKLILRQLKKNYKLASGDTYIGLGILNLKLDEYLRADHRTYGVNHNYNYTKCATVEETLKFDLLNNVSIRLSVSAQIINDENDYGGPLNETMSVASDWSKSDGTIGATFSEGDIDASHYDPVLYASPLSARATTHLPTPIPTQHNQHQHSYESIRECDENDAENSPNTNEIDTTSQPDESPANNINDNDMHDKESELETHNERLTEVNYNNQQRESSKYVEGMPTTIDLSIVRESASAYGARSSEQMDNIRYTQTSVLVSSPYTHRTNAPSQQVLEGSERMDLNDLLEWKKDKSTSPIRQPLNLVQMQGELESLRALRVTQENVIYSLKQETVERDEITQRDALNLRKELTEVKAALKREQSGRAALAAANDFSDSLIGESLSHSREELSQLSSEYAAVAAKLEQTTEEFEALKIQYSKVARENENATNALKDVAAAITVATMRRADLEQENNELIDELIVTKVRCANYAADVDKEVIKRFEMSRTIRKYATRVAALEVHLTEFAGMRLSTSTIEQAELSPNQLN